MAGWTRSAVLNSFEAVLFALPYLGAAQLRIKWLRFPWRTKFYQKNIFLYKIHTNIYKRDFILNQKNNLIVKIANKIIKIFININKI